MELGRYIVEKGGRNLSIELEDRQTKLGGNMPIMSHALARLGMNVSCIGALGHPALHPVFAPMADLCTLYSYADPGLSTALEFDDGKIMLGQMRELRQADWQTIKTRVGLPLLIRLFGESDLLALLNWSELDQSTAIWKGIVEEVLPFCHAPEKQMVYIDLSDCSHRNGTDLRKALDLLDQFAAGRNLVLSLNLNEAEVIHELFRPGQRPIHREDLGHHLFEHLPATTLVLHHARQSLAWEQDGSCQAETRYIEHPKISTGAGDHFNAGFALGKLMELDLLNCLALGNETSGHYLKTGLSPDWNDLLNAITMTDL
ncbi:MAG: hypothetical protein HUU01_19035 [Saprospiraceae bacterium]|nr:hypothetical protein [Saprospiraceae bacterium]